MASENSPQKEEIDKRRDNALRRALTTPPKPKRESEKGKEKPGTAKRKTKSS